MARNHAVARIYHQYLCFAIVPIIHADLTRDCGSVVIRFTRIREFSAFVIYRDAFVKLDVEKYRLDMVRLPLGQDYGLWEQLNVSYTLVSIRPPSQQSSWAYHGSRRDPKRPPQNEFGRQYLASFHLHHQPRPCGRSHRSSAAWPQALALVLFVSVASDASASFVATASVKRPRLAVEKRWRRRCKC